MPLKRYELWMQGDGDCFEATVIPATDGELVYFTEAQAEIDVTYGKAFVAGKKNGEETMQDEIDELVEMNRMMWDRMGSVPKQYLINAYPDLFDKHKGK